MTGTRTVAGIGCNVRHPSGINDLDRFHSRVVVVSVDNRAKVEIQTLGSRDAVSGDGGIKQRSVGEDPNSRRDRRRVDDRSRRRRHAVEADELQAEAQVVDKAGTRNRGLWQINGHSILNQFADDDFCVVIVGIVDACADEIFGDRGACDHGQRSG